MRYILPADALTNINFLRVDYQKERNVDLDKSPSMFGTPIIFGGTDVVARDAQTKFIKKMMVVFAANLLKEEQITTSEQAEASLTASRVIIAACQYVQSQISKPKKNSVLYGLINKDLGITEENYLDDEDKNICNLAANRLINSSIMAIEDANKALRIADMEPFSEVEWEQFSKYLADAAKNATIENPYANYPITSITKPMFGAAFAYTGATIGFLGGGMVSESTKIMSTKVQMTALIGSTLLMLGPAGPMGVALFSQVIAGKLITSFCSISLGHILGTAMGILGQGVGMGIGLPLDAAYRLIWKTCSIIGTYYTDSQNPATGIRIKDGMRMIGGIEIKATSELELAELASNFELAKVEFKDNSIFIAGKEITGDEAKALTQLKLQLEPYTKELASVVAVDQTELSL
ncbi:type IV secretion protein Dot [uncultured Legionella sp.]|uniref:type IV secretion protein Dot n=1 Tax=uncultured Legionella sp. TaxID=210934 RepID=UPI00262A6301|nr:type IV secretion protein Dot [uncultured Legionella sp.]